jgi:hypothetical protein
VSEPVPLSANAGSVVEITLKPKKTKRAYTAYQNIHVKIGQDQYTYSEAWRMAAKGEKKDYFSVPDDLRDQLYYSDATIWLEPGGLDRTYQEGTPHDADTPWGTQPGKFELRPIPDGVRTIRRRTTLRWDTDGRLLLPIVEKRTVQVHTAADELLGGAPPDVEFERQYGRQLAATRGQPPSPAADAPSPAPDAPAKPSLDSLYDEEMTQREFMLKALESDDELTPGKVMTYWQERKTLEAEPQDLPSESEYYARLDDDKLEALNDAYYRELKGAMGVRAFWEWFKRNNAKQRQSLQDAKDGKETGKTRPRKARYRATEGDVYKYKVRPWISWREVRAYVSAQESNQLMRPANPKTTAMATTFKKDMLHPFVRFQLDVIDMSKTQDRDKSYADSGFSKIFNMVDVYSGYTWQMAAKNDTARNAVEFVERVLGSIEERWDRAGVTTLAEIKTDNGASFSHDKFVVPLQQSLQHWQITFRKANSNTPNQMAFIENANREWRNIARRVLEVKSGNLTEAQLKAKPAGARWHGGPTNQALGVQLREINALMNKRPNTTRGNESPSRILEAALEPGQGFDESGQPRTEEQDKELMKRVNATLLKSQASRRGASTIKPYQEGDLVRLINAKYLKASTRSNALKMGPRWSRTVYQITKVRGRTGVPEYRVEPVEDLYKGDFDNRTQWYAHDRVQKVLLPDDVKQTPVLDKVSEAPTYRIDKDMPGGQRYYQDYPFAEER